MIKPLKILLLLFTTLSIISCAQIDKKIETIKPTAKLVGTRLADINFEKADLIFDVAVKNKNPFSVRLASLDYDLKIADNSFISGVTGQGIKIKKSSTSKIALPVTLKFDDLKKIPGELWKADQLPYQLDTKINVKLPVIGNYAVPFSKKGEVPVPKLPSIKLKNLQVENLSLTSADLLAEVEIDNPNIFKLGLSDFNYKLNINQKTWGEGSSSDSSSIPQKGKGTIQIPLKLNLLSMGKTAYQLVAGGKQFDYQLLGGVTLDTGLEYLRKHKMPLDIKGTTAFK